MYTLKNIYDFINEANTFYYIGPNKDFRVKDTMIRYPGNVNEKTWTGSEVARHIEDITPEESDVPTFFIDNYVLPNTFTLKKVDLKKLLKTDPSFKEYYDSKEERYYQDEVNPNDLDYELVIHNGELLDGYSRASEKLRRGERYAEAFVSKSI